MSRWLVIIIAMLMAAIINDSSADSDIHEKNSVGGGEQLLNDWNSCKQASECIAVYDVCMNIKSINKHYLKQHREITNKIRRIVNCAASKCLYPRKMQDEYLNEANRHTDCIENICVITLDELCKDKTDYDAEKNRIRKRKILGEF